MGSAVFLIQPPSLSLGCLDVGAVPSGTAGQRPPPKLQRRPPSDPPTGLPDAAVAVSEPESGEPVKDAVCEATLRRARA